MEGGIVNRVAKSPLVTIDLEDYYPEGPRIRFDIAPWLWEGLVVKEKEFREAVAALDTEPFRDAYIAVYCSTDAIVPAWAFTLTSLKLNETANKVVLGSLEDLENTLFTEIIHAMDVSEFKNKPLIIKGCSNKPIPQNAYLLLAQKLKPVAKSIMYGEACSSVPLYKPKKSGA